VIQNKYIARMRLTPDASKMIVSLHSGQLVLIKNLDLTKKNELEVNLGNVSNYISSCLTAALRANPESGSKILVPVECIRKTNQIELLLEPGRGYSTSLQLDPSGRYLLTRRHMIDKSEECCVFDLEKSNPHDDVLKNDYLTTGKHRSSLRDFFNWYEDTDDEEDITITNEEDAERLDLQSNAKAENITHRANFVPVTTSVRNAFPYRLLFQIEDSHNEEGFIKGPCFSSNGRFFCSPYHRGVRIFDFLDGVQQQERERAYGKQVKYDLPSFVNLVNTHSAGVLTTRYHPFLPMFASGGIDGRVCFYMPQV